MSEKLENVLQTQIKIIRWSFWLAVGIEVIQILKIILFFLFEKYDSFITNFNYFKISHFILFTILTIALLVFLVQFIEMDYYVNLLHAIKNDKKINFLACYFVIKKYFKLSIFFRKIRKEAEIYINEF